MADQTTESISIAAPPERIMGVIADFPAYPEWAGAVKSAVVLAEGPDGNAESVVFGLDAGAFKDTYTLGVRVGAGRPRSALAADQGPDAESPAWLLCVGAHW